MDVLHRKAEACQFVHCLAIIIVPAAVGTEIEAPDSRGVLLDASQLRHIGRGFFVRHIDTIPVLVAEDAVHIVAVLIAAVVGLGATHFDFVLQDLRHHPGLGAGLILDGKLYRGANDMAGEAGHIRLSSFGPVGYGKAGSFEGFC